ncbi:MAG: GNAT family N-acetyltransferase [Planctomycetota bacterium]|jgi:GNAT superfamily N-acetyltransferase
MQITVQPVVSRRDQREFIKFAWDLYRGDPNWVPPLLMSIKELLGYKRHSFYGNGAIQTFLARSGGKIVGRIAAIIDGAHNQTHQEQRGMIGFFESINDHQVAAALFDAARKWLRDKGMTSLRGPLNPALNYECALLIDGFDSPPTFLMTYNKDYYPSLFEHYGFRKSQDLFAFWGHVNMLETLDPKLLSLAAQVQERFQITVRPSTKATFADDIDAFLKIYNRALPGTWGFVPLSDAEVKQIASGLKLLIVPDLVRIAEHEGKPVGAVFGLLDYNPIIKQIDGRLFPFGFLKILFGRKKLKRIRLVSTNVLPEYQRFGLPLVLMKSLLESAMAWGIEEGEFSWVLESNHLSRATLERGGAKLIKTYRIYDLDPA